MSQFFQGVTEGSLPPTVPLQFVTDDGTAVPAAHVLNVLGQKNGIISVMETNASGNNVYVEDRTSTTAFVVDPSGTLGQRGTYQTIQAAVTAAPSGSTVFIKNGTYTENVALKPGVNLVAYAAPFTAGVTIQGKLSLTSAGTVTVSGIALVTNGSYSVSVTGSAASKVYLINCAITSSNFTPFELSSSSNNSLVFCTYCLFSTATSSFGFFSVSGAGSFHIFGCSDPGATVTSVQSTFSSSGVLRIENSVLRFPITTSGNGRIAGVNSTISTVAAPARTCLTIGGNFSTDTITNFIRQCALYSGTQTAIVMSQDLDLNNCSISSNNTHPISGTGVLNYSGNTYVFGTFVPDDTTITMLRRPIDGGRYVGDWSGGSVLAGTIGEILQSQRTFGSATSLVTATNKDVTTLTLTAGIWSITGIVQFSGFTTSTQQVASISSTSATLGTYGDNTVSANFATAPIDDVGVVVPSYPYNVTPAMVLAGTNIVYLVARATFTGACSAYGTIRAERRC